MVVLVIPPARPTNWLFCWAMSSAGRRRGSGGGGGVADRVEAAAVRRQVRAVRAVRGGAGAGGAAGRRQPRGRGEGELHRLQASQLEVQVRRPASPGSVIRLS